MAIIFSLVCIGLAAFSFLLDFDAADQMIRAGAPEKAAWGIALGLTVTLVWLYIEILRLLSTSKRLAALQEARHESAGFFVVMRRAWVALRQCGVVGLPPWPGSAAVHGARRYVESRLR